MGSTAADSSNLLTNDQDTKVSNKTSTRFQIDDKIKNSSFGLSTTIDSEHSREENKILTRSRSPDPSIERDAHKDSSKSHRSEPIIEDYRSRLRKRPANRLQYNLIGVNDYYQAPRPIKRKASPRRSNASNKGPEKAKRTSPGSLQSRRKKSISPTKPTATKSQNINEMSDEELVCLVPLKDLRKSPVRNKSPIQLRKQTHNEKTFDSNLNDERRARSPNSNCTHDDHTESILRKAVQIFIPFIIAGLGTVGAGIVLDHVQHWNVFKTVNEIYILLPALLGLKGNLEMTLASRLSTQANLGKVGSKRDKFLMASGNIALTQCQATVVSLLACIVAISIQLVLKGQFNMTHALLITASALITSSLASLVLGLVMISIVFTAHSFDINPDNICSPIAASLGDLLTLSLYAYLTNVFYVMMSGETFYALSTGIMLIFILLIPVWIYAARANPYTSDILYNGWFPIISAMIIGTVSGWFLNLAVSRYVGIAVFHPVICGVGGNLVAVQASRLSTYLHKTASGLGQLPEGQTGSINPLPIIFGRNSNSATLRLLLALAIPGHLFYIAIIAASELGHMKITPLFMLVYVIAAEMQILCLLYLAYVLSYSMWLRCVDPDNSSIPYLTALGDLFGIIFLAAAFGFMHAIQGDEFDKSMNIDNDVILVPS